MITNANHLNKLNSPVRYLQAKVELYNGSTLVATYAYDGDLNGFTIERVGEEKFFGFGICQKINIKIRDKNRAKNITTANHFRVSMNYVGGSYVVPFPKFYVTEVHRDENTNELSVTAYDRLYEASTKFVNELALPAVVEEGESSVNYTILQFAETVAGALGLDDAIVIGNGNPFTTLYEGGANFGGGETLREALNAVAEATQTIYYVNNKNELVFKTLDIAGNALLNIDKEKYITLDSKTNRRLANITHTTELGENTFAQTTESGSTQFVRDNPFWNMREDIATLLSNAIANVGGLTINQFDCTWRGNYLLEIGDKISLTTKDNGVVNSYLLDDTITYNGAYTQKSKWKYADNEEETAATPVTIGEALRQTYAKVDKVNQQIDLVVKETEGFNEKIASIEENAESISASVTELSQVVTENQEAVNQEISTLKETASLAITKDQVKIAIEEELSNGVDKVTTSTGYTFGEDGLLIEKSDSEMSTQITEDGMTVYKNDEAVLTANNQGVNAQNLHATTYLIIGENSRFEDFVRDGEARTGCFWIGG